MPGERIRLPERPPKKGKGGTVKKKREKKREPELPPDYNRRAVPRSSSKTIRGQYGKPIYIWNIGCLHYGSPSFSWDSLELFRELWAEKFTKDTNHYAFLTGDLFDAYRSTSQAAKRGLDLTDFNHSLDEWSLHYAEKFEEDFSFLAGNILGSIEGNHGNYIRKISMTVDEYIAHRFKADHKKHGAILLYTLNIVVGKQTFPINIMVLHGRSAGGVYVGTLLNELERLAGKFNASIVLAAHAHTPVSGKFSKIDFSEDGIEASPVVLSRTGSWNKAYEEGQEHYAVERLYRPSDLSMTYTTITPVKFRGETKLLLHYHG